MICFGNVSGTTRRTEQAVVGEVGAGSEERGERKEWVEGGRGLCWT